jgi:two-component system CheB/CheR fusion protein
MSDADPPPAMPAAIRPRDPAASAEGGSFCVAGIGASSGGLDACKKFLSALRASTNTAFILVQHLDPNHASMMVELLASSTQMNVLQAKDGMIIEPDKIYVIPPGSYLAASNGALRLSAPLARHGARLPFDFLLQSLAAAYGSRAICIVLSGTGADGSLGLAAIKAAGGLVIAQDPGDAGYRGMPDSAIATDDVDVVLPAEDIAEAVLAYSRKLVTTPAGDDLQKVILLLRDQTPHDFTLYKPGTLERRIARRMGMAGLGVTEMDKYLDLLRADRKERDMLTEDLLINVTSFFRDPKIFETLAETVIPDIIAAAAASHRPVRLWVAGCSTGEETYSLTMLFLEQMRQANSNVKLQVFASDVNPQAIATARNGCYPSTIEEDVSADRLERFFVKEEYGYRVCAELRGTVVFTVQDVLADPPFSKLDMVSCRNLLIYLRQEAQTKIISVFNFALREAGILLLGSAESVSAGDARFAVISKPARLYRKMPHSGPADFRFPTPEIEPARVLARLTAGRPQSRHLALAELSRRMMLERFAPASVLINRKFECLYSSGPTERYLQVAPGYPTHDILSMTRPGMRVRLKAAIIEAVDTDSRIILPGGRTRQDGEDTPFAFDIQPVKSENEQLLLICFIDTPVRTIKRTPRGPKRDASRLDELEHELQATRAELQQAIRSLEISGEEQNAINEEALSVNEEYQSTNEELLTSKEELQSLNEELTALNSQLQESLERQRTAANDLQNILYSTDVATLFLDANLKIRFFTPAATAVFTLIQTDIGRPLTDLHARTADNTLSDDAMAVLRTAEAVEREIQTETGAWFNRRIMPYRTEGNGTAGVVITFADVTLRKQTAKALEEATREAERANMAKSRFLAAASHDLRQPLQTLSLLKGLLDKIVEEAPARKLLVRLEETTGAMSGMLNTLLDINQIDAGVVQPTVIDFPINTLLNRLRDEFTYHAEAQGLGFRVMPCRLIVRSDQHLLEQMIRNLVSNALKYTKSGRILVGCRRRGTNITLEVWDTGIGIPQQELQSIFDEYHQIDNPGRDRNRGLGLGLSIVQRLAGLLGHRIDVRSNAGKGSVFAVEVATIPGASEPPMDSVAPAPAAPPVTAGPRRGSILVIEDDPDIRDLLGKFLQEEGYQPTVAAGGTDAFEMVISGHVHPDLILADYNLPDGLNGLQVATKLRVRTRRQIPVIILTGDISTNTLRDIATAECIQLTKPMALGELTIAMQRLLPPAEDAIAVPEPSRARNRAPVIYIVDDDAKLRQSMRAILESDGREVESFSSCEAFLEAFQPGREACLLLDSYLPGMGGLELLQQLNDAGQLPPAIMITGHSDVKMAVRAMKAGATDFIEKPAGSAEVLAAVRRALEQSTDAAKAIAWRDSAASQLASLTARQREIMDLVLAGHPSKNIAHDLNISQRTVENHRAAIMAKTGAKSLPALARLALAAR